MLSNFYLIALCAVGVAIVAAVLDAVVSVSRRHEWQVERPAPMLVAVDDRRTEALPFVGAERRDAEVVATAEVDARRAA